MIPFFLPPRILVGYFLAYFSFFPWIHRHCRVQERDPDALQPEIRLYWLLWGECTKALHSFFANLDSGTASVNWTVWFCLDQLGSTACALDCADDIFRLDRHSQCKFVPSSEVTFNLC